MYCDKEQKFNVGDEYTIRSLDANLAKKYVEEHLGEKIYNFTHWYVDIETKDDNNQKCVFTFGLKMDSRRKQPGFLPGFFKYPATELRSPDFSDSICNSKCDINSLDETCIKNHCIGALKDKDHQLFRGKTMVDINKNEYKGTLNPFQVAILEWFQANAKEVKPSKGKTFYTAELPFTFSWTPDFCSVKNWGKNEYYNCQKFAVVFHTNPESILEHIDPERYKLTKHFYTGGSRSSRKTKKSHRKTHRKSHRKTHCKSNKKTHRKSNKKTHRKSHRKTHRKSHRKTHRKSHRKTHRKSHRKTHRKSHRKTHRKSHRKTHRKSHRKTHRHTKRMSGGNRDSVLRRAGVSGYNRPKRTPSHPTKSHIVVAKEGNRIKTIRFGQQGVRGSPKRKGESDYHRKRRNAFRARHAKNIAKGKMSAAYWANKVKW